jgi:hypothetical protein
MVQARQQKIDVEGLAGLCVIIACWRFTFKRVVQLTVLVTDQWRAERDAAWQVAQLSDREAIAVDMVCSTLDLLAWLVGEDARESER